jgi:hypothetical protein
VKGKSEGVRVYLNEGNLTQLEQRGGGVDERDAGSENA